MTYKAILKYNIIPFPVKKLVGFCYKYADRILSCPVSLQHQIRKYILYLVEKVVAAQGLAQTCANKPFNFQN